MRILDPGHQAMITSAVAQARAAGVPEETIQRVIEQEQTAHGGGVVAPVIAGRLRALASQFQSRQQPPPGA